MNPNEKPGTPTEIMHFGVRGMRWGVRKRSSGVGGSSKTTTKSFGKTKSGMTPEQRAAAQQGLKKAGKTALKVGVRVGVVGLLAAVGLPVAIAGASVAALETASPEVIKAGQLYAQDLLPEVALKKFSALNQFRIGLVAGIGNPELVEQNKANRAWNR